MMKEFLASGLTVAALTLFGAGETDSGDRTNRPEGFIPIRRDVSSPQGQSVVLDDELIPDFGSGAYL